MAIISNLLWIDPQLDNEQKNKYLNRLESLRYFKVKFYKNIEESINEIKKIEFEETIIIINENSYIKFISKFKENLRYIYIIPKIIIFAEKKDEFLIKNKEQINIINHPFYNSGGIKTNFDEIKSYILNPLRKIVYF